MTAFNEELRSFVLGEDMHVKYVGPDSKGVSCQAGRIYFPRNKAVEVDPELGRSLVSQSTFKEVKPRSKAQPKDSE